MKMICDVPDEVIKSVRMCTWCGSSVLEKMIVNGTPIPDNATNGDAIEAMFGADKVFGFIHYVRLMAKVGNWFNEGVVAEFDKDWWNAPYQKGGKE